MIELEHRYIRCNYNDTSVAVAITLAAVGNQLLVAGDQMTADVLEHANVKMLRDVRTYEYDAVIDTSILEMSSRSVFIFQDPKASHFLSDFAIMQRAAYMPWNRSSKAQKITLENVSRDGAAAYGWGPENDYVTTLNEHGVWVCHKNKKKVENITHTRKHHHINTGTRV